MARYVLTDDVVFEGLPYKRGDILNAPQQLPEVLANIAVMTNVPRVRVAGLQHDHPNAYLAIAKDEDKLGYQHADKKFPKDASGNSNVIQEPVLPTENKQYD